jgi:hypothetical protein
VSCESLVSSSNARTASTLKRSMRMPLAWPMTSRLASAESNWCRVWAASKAVARGWPASRLGRGDDGVGLAAQQVQCCGAAAVGVELKGQHAAYAGSDRGRGVSGPAFIGSQIRAAHHQLVVERCLQARTLVEP